MKFIGCIMLAGLALILLAPHVGATGPFDAIGLGLLAVATVFGLLITASN